VLQMGVRPFIGGHFVRIRKFTTLFAAGLALTFSILSFGSLAAASGLVPVEAFAKMPAAIGVKLSPNGDYYAGLMMVGGEERLAIVPTDGSVDKVRFVAYGDYTPGFFRWGSNNHVVIELTLASRRGSRGTRTMESRLGVIDVETGKLDILIKHKLNRGKHFSQFQSNIVSLLPDDDEHILVQLDENQPLVPDVFKVNLKTKGRSVHRRGRTGISKWMADAQGNVRMGYGRIIVAGYYSNKVRIVFRETADDSFKVLEDFNAGENNSFPIEGFTEDAHIILISKLNEHGRNSLYKFDTRTMAITETLFSHEQYDYSSYQRAPNSNRVVAVNYIADGLKTHHLDDVTAAEAAGLETLFPGYISRVVSRTRDGNKIIVRGSSADKSSTYYYIDLVQGLASEVSPVYPSLIGIEMPMPSSIMYTARDGLEIPGFLTKPLAADEKPGPMIVFPHGGPNSRDMLRFDPWVQYFASRGWSVLQMNFRGSTGYGDLYQEKGYKEWGLAMQDDITDGVKWTISEGIADPDRICIVGISYGGYAALEGTVKTPDLYKCAIGVNGVYDLDARRQQQKRYVSYHVWQDYMTFENPNALSPTKNVEAIQVPVMIAFTEDDRTVNERQSKELISALKRKKKSHVALELKEGGHSLEKEADRLKFFREMDKFLQQHLGLGPIPIQASQK
jgi:dipeptidyl aminopeptidase/acylaminoacyl peptidase